MLHRLLILLLVVLLLSACSDQDKPPQTPRAEEARAVVAPQSNARRSGGELLERVSTVLDGYQAYRGQLPQNLQDLDQGGYMFDSAYLAEILPEGAELYLSLSADKGDTRMWLQQTAQGPVLSRTLADAHLAELTVEELRALQGKWQELARVGRLAQVRL